VWLPSNKTFRRLFVGQTVSLVGDGMQRVGLLWWAKANGGTPTVVAVALSVALPLVLVSPFGGVLADRIDATRLLVGADALRVVTTGMLCVLFAFFNPAQIIVCALIVTSSVASAIFEPTYLATIPRIVPRDELASATGIGLANSAAGGLLGPMIGGFMLSVASLPLLLLINAGSFVWSAIFVYSARIPSLVVDKDSLETSEAQVHQLRFDVRGTVAVIRSVHGLPRLVGLTTVLNAAVAPIAVLIVALCADKLALGASGYGYLQAIFGTGVLVGSIASGRKLRGRAFLPLQALALSLAFVAVLNTVGCGLALLVAGVAMAQANVELSTAFQMLVPDHVRGRVYGLASAISTATRPAGLLLAAPLLSLVGVTRAFVLVAGLIAFSTVVWGRGQLSSRVC
jgi:MFS transporter, DHA3 family, macrolide efflux protein